MLNPHEKIIAVDVYFEKRKSRDYVGRLSRENNKFIFIYDDHYLFKDRSIPIGPDLPLTQKKFMMRNLFPSFEDRIPSNKNPAYKDYCKMVGIHPNEKDELTLVATLGQKGPSSFIFSPVIQPASPLKDELIHFRKKLDLTIREFCLLFEFAPATILKLENHVPTGKDTLKRLEIYYQFPEVALYEIEKNRFKINEQKIKRLEHYFKQQLSK